MTVTLKKQAPADLDYTALLLEWTKRLGLTDWRLRLKTNCKADDMPDADANAVGCTQYSESVKAAYIYILDPADYGERVVPFDGEEVLVHELLHLKMSLIQDVENDLQERFVHQLLDDIARALVNAKHCEEGRC